jgi:hypothetical protein
VQRDWSRPADGEKPSVRSPMSLAGCGKRQRGPCTACAMTGLGAVDYRVPINRHVRPACSLIKHSSNGLHDTLQRALGPDLGHSAVHVYSQSVANPPAACAPRTPTHPSRLCPGNSPVDLCRRLLPAQRLISPPITLLTTGLLS